MKKYLLILVLLCIPNIIVIAQNKEQIKDSISHLLCGVWKWVGTSGGLSGGGYGGPKENGYNVAIDIKCSKGCDSILYKVYIDSMLEKEGKTIIEIDAIQNEYSMHKVYDLMPRNQFDIVFPLAEYDENGNLISDPNLKQYVLFRFLTSDKLIFTGECSDCFEYLYAREKPNTIGSSSLIGNEVHISPNPTNSILKLIGLKQNVAISIFNTSGKIVLSKQLTDNHIDVSNLINGIYIIRMTTENRNVAKKFVKQ